MSCDQGKVFRNSQRTYIFWLVTYTHFVRYTCLATCWTGVPVPTVALCLLGRSEYFRPADLLGFSHRMVQKQKAWACRRTTIGQTTTCYNQGMNAQHIKQHLKYLGFSSRISYWMPRRSAEAKVSKRSLNCAKEGWRDVKPFFQNINVLVLWLGLRVTYQSPLHMQLGWELQTVHTIHIIFILFKLFSQHSGYVTRRDHHRHDENVSSQDKRNYPPFKGTSRAKPCEHNRGPDPW